jgi:SAM-dependent methyltransferase
VSCFNCPVCSSANIFVFGEIQRVPAHSNRLFKTQEQALAALRVTMKLAACSDCSHIFNAAFRPDLIDYEEDYENSLEGSPTPQSYATNLAAMLIDRYGLRRKRVLEIGCGKGEFLKMLCLLGDNYGIGFDPGAPDVAESGVTFIRDFYCENSPNLTVDLVCCTHTLEHIDRPREFLAMLQRNLCDSLDTVLFFEVPNVLFTLKQLSIWDIIFEHCSYFSGTSLAYLFSSCGFRVLRVTEGFDRQFLWIEAKPARAKTDCDPQSTSRHNAIARELERFRRRYEGKIGFWRERLGGSFAEQRLVVWGAESKGVSFLNTVALPNQINYVVDVNPRKHGMYVPGSGQRIVPPEFLKEYRPDAVIIMNPIYRNEIGARTRALGINPPCICA